MPEEVTFETPRGLRLAGTLRPGSGGSGGSAGSGGSGGSGGAGIVFAHNFLAERTARGRFEVLAEGYAAAGYATLTFDFSGCGASDDDVVTVEHEVEDLRAASAFLAAAGWPRQAVHGHSLGALVALRALPPDVRTMVLTGPVTAPLAFAWEDAFAPAQWAELQRDGVTAVIDDGPSGRASTVVSTRTLRDFAEIDQEGLLAAVPYPVLLVHGGALADGEEHELLTRSRVGLPWLPEGSRLEVVRGAEHALAEHLPEVLRLGLDWLRERLPV